MNLKNLYNIDLHKTWIIPDENDQLRLVESSETTENKQTLAALFAKSLSILSSQLKISDPTSAFELMHGIKALDNLISRGEELEVWQYEGGYAALSQLRDSSHDVLKQTASKINHCIQEHSFTWAARLIEKCGHTREIFEYMVDEGIPSIPYQEVPALFKGTSIMAEEFMRVEDAIQFIQAKEENLAIFLRSFSPKNIDHAREYLAKLGEALGKKEVLLDFAEFFDQPHKIGVNMNAFNRFDERQAQFLQKMQTHHILPDTDSLKECLCSYNYPYIRVLCNNLPGQLSEEHALLALNALQMSQDPELATILLEKDPDLAKRCPFTLIASSVQNSQHWFIDWLDKNGRPLKKDEAEQLISEYAPYQIPLRKHLCQIAEIDESIGFALDFLKDEKDRLQKLREISLFSPLESIYAFVADHPEFAPALSSVVQESSLFVKFPHQRIAADLYSETYFTNTIDYALRNLEDIDTLREEVADLSRAETLDMIVEYRFERNAPLSREYQEKAKDSPIQYVTPLYNLKKKTDFSNENQHPVTADIHFIRYSWCLRHLAKECLDSESNRWHAPEGSAALQPKLGMHNCLWFSYPLQEEDGTFQSLPTTTFNDEWKIMQHTSPETIQRLEEHVEELHDYLFHFDLDPADEEQLKYFYQMTARAYWLISTLCEYHRGTPHNAMMYLNLIYQHHHLPSPVPKMDHYFLDNSMLVTPIEKAIQDWETYFEPTLDQSLNKTHGRASKELLLKLLSADGLLLKECSWAIRTDPEFTEVAIKQNPEAALYCIEK